MTEYEELLSISETLSADQITELLKQARQYKAADKTDDTKKNTDNTSVPRTRNKVPRPDCPYCASKSVVLDGKQCGKQRYWCKSCNHSFVPTTNTLMSKSHYDKGTWETVINDTFQGVSIDDTADKLNIPHRTVFRMRHKVLLALQFIEENLPTELKNIAELDETYVLESEKGKKFDENATREPRKRGSKASKRGLSNEQICICTGVERNQGSSYAVTVNRAKPSNKELKEAFSSHIEEGTVLFTDGLKGYKVLEEEVDCMVTGVSTEEMKASKTANLNNVNSFHSFIKTRYHNYRGVASKYINRYNALFASGFRDRKETIRQICDLVLTLRDDDIHMRDIDVEEKNLFMAT
ncbi:MAG: IS1595 family transposase [Clostridia bacterium]|nr:IS1595 family transposase [Clostridia bacterium]